MWILWILDSMDKVEQHFSNFLDSAKYSHAQICVSVKLLITSRYIQNCNWLNNAFLQSSCGSKFEDSALTI